MKEKAILRELSRTSGRTTARLVVDKDDPFFFDHALDHVPGILLTVALLDLVRTESGGLRSDGRIRMSLDFHKFCELDDDITVSVSPSVSGTEDESVWELAAEIGPSTACSGTAVLHRTSSERFVPATPARHGESLPVSELTHRTRPENCLLGAAWWGGERLLARVQRPPVGHLLRTRPLTELIEAARQFATLIGHVGYGRPIGDKFILCALEVDLPLGLMPGEVCMEWVRRPVDRRMHDLAMRLYRLSGDDFDEDVGSASLDMLIVPPPKYQSIRFRKRRVEERAI